MSITTTRVVTCDNCHTPVLPPRARMRYGAAAYGMDARRLAAAMEMSE